MIEFTKWKKPEIITFDWYAKEFKLPSSSNQNEQKEQIIAWINQATDMVNNITNNVVYDYYPILEDKAKNGTISEAEERSVHFLQQAIGKTVEYISMLGGKFADINTNINASNVPFSLAVSSDNADIEAKRKDILGLLKSGGWYQSIILPVENASVSLPDITTEWYIKLMSIFDNIYVRTDFNSDIIPNKQLSLNNGILTNSGGIYANQYPRAEINGFKITNCEGPWIDEGYLSDYWNIEQTKTYLSTNYYSNTVIDSKLAAINTDIGNIENDFSNYYTKSETDTFYNNLNNDIKTINSDITNLTNKVQGIDAEQVKQNGDITNLEGEVSTIKTDLSDLGNVVNDNTNSINNLTKDKVLLSQPKIRWLNWPAHLQIFVDNNLFSSDPQAPNYYKNYKLCFGVLNNKIRYKNTVNRHKVMTVMFKPTGKGKPFLASERNRLVQKNIELKNNWEKEKEFIKKSLEFFKNELEKVKKNNDKKQISYLENIIAKHKVRLNSGAPVLYAPINNSPLEYLKAIGFDETKLSLNDLTIAYDETKLGNWTNYVSYDDIKACLFKWDVNANPFSEQNGRAKMRFKRSVKRTLRQSNYYLQCTYDLVAFWVKNPPANFQTITKIPRENIGNYTKLKLKAYLVKATGDIALGKFIFRID